MARTKKQQEAIDKKEAEAAIAKAAESNITVLPEAPEIEASDLPIFKALSLYNLPDHGKSGWVVLTMTIQGDKVLDVESSEPNLRQIAIEQLKMDTVKQFFNPYE